MTRLTTPRIERIVSIDDPDFPAWAAGFVEDGRRSEVMMVARKSAGDVWLHRKGAWRLPTGTIEPGERRLAALHREVQEEFGVSLPVCSALAVLLIGPRAPGVYGAFTSYVSALDAGDHVPPPVVAEGSDEWRLVDPHGLRRVAADLRDLPPSTDRFGRRWDLWGAFRAIEHDVVAELLVSNGRSSAHERPTTS